MIYVIPAALIIILSIYLLTLYAFNRIAAGRKYTEEECFELVECRALYSRKEFEELDKTAA
jgi:hypothetical protein